MRKLYRVKHKKKKYYFFHSLIYPGYSKQSHVWIKTKMNLVCQDIRLSNKNGAVRSMSTWWNIQGGQNCAYFNRNFARIKNPFSQRFSSTKLGESKWILVNILVFHTKLYCEIHGFLQNSTVRIQMDSHTCMVGNIWPGCWTEFPLYYTFHV